MAKVKRCFSGIGGQAVLEGIMMKNQDKYAVAVRKPNGEIAVEVKEASGGLSNSVLKKIPFIRGVFVLIDSLVLGIRSLNMSAEYFDEEEPREDGQKTAKKAADNLWSVFTTMLAIAIALAVFVVLPYYLAEFLNTWIRNDSLMALIEGLLRVVIFVAYVAGISLMKDIRRVYMYHGAEHKCINCIENGLSLNVTNVMKSSRQHKRCGTSFMLYVMIISIIIFFFIRVDMVWLRVLLRFVMIPVVAGLSYEFIRFAGSHEGPVINALSAAGLWLQGLTTKEPDESMAEVAIAAVNAVFDWKAFQEEMKKDQAE
ncbi:MAG: DUF1385 domain-containing protein [Lachnospiraceae bacterium]|nr:DUF1385 domain-containing protein [Lachnospiraceae bacterium]